MNSSGQGGYADYHAGLSEKAQELERRAQSLAQQEAVEMERGLDLHIIVTAPRPASAGRSGVPSTSEPAPGVPQQQQHQQQHQPRVQPLPVQQPQLQQYQQQYSQQYPQQQPAPSFSFQPLLAQVPGAAPPPSLVSPMLSAGPPSQGVRYLQPAAGGTGSGGQLAAPAAGPGAS